MSRDQRLAIVPKDVLSKDGLNATRSTSVNATPDVPWKALRPTSTSVPRAVPLFKVVGVPLLIHVISLTSPVPPILDNNPNQFELADPLDAVPKPILAVPINAPTDRDWETMEHLQP